MPLYDLRCSKGHEFEYFKHIDDDLPLCDCGSETKIIIKQINVIQDSVSPFTSCIDNSVITSKSGYREHLRRHDCHVVEDVPNAVKDWQDKQKELPPEKRAKKNGQVLVK